LPRPIAIYRKSLELGCFRDDLFYRLSVFPIEVPPLRERREDIPLLAAHFVKFFAKKMNTQAQKLPKGNIEQLQAYDWPGNIRELQNVIERAVILAQTGALRFDFVRLERSQSRGSVDIVTLRSRMNPIPPE
jgi:transcriptional regulator with GAF, ATPase, and Fis domain